MSKFLRENLRDFKNYEVEEITEQHISNANELPTNLIVRYQEELLELLLKDANRYPDPLSTEVRIRLADYISCNPEEIIVGNGADECIKIILETYISPKDTIIVHDPSFAMYEISGLVQDATVIRVPDKKEFQIDIDGIIEAANQHKAKLIFLCTPNNPTGFMPDRSEIIRVIENTEAIVVIDEAYVEFADTTNTDLYADRVIILRTMSKAFGLAGIRVGYAITSEQNIKDLLKVKPPYNLNRISQQIAAFALDHRTEILQELEPIKKERDRMIPALNKIEGVKAYPSCTNFILVQVRNKEKIRKNLKNYSIKIKDYGENTPLHEFFRITVSVEGVNDLMLKAFGEA